MRICLSSNLSIGRELKCFLGAEEQSRMQNGTLVWSGHRAHAAVKKVTWKNWIKSSATNKTVMELQNHLLQHKGPTYAQNRLCHTIISAGSSSSSSELAVTTGLSSRCFLTTTVSGSTMRGFRMELKITSSSSSATIWRPAFLHACTKAPLTAMGSNTEIWIDHWKNWNKVANMLRLTNSNTWSNLSTLNTP
jgi:hypothetical protein